MPKNAFAPKPASAVNRLLVETAAYPQYGELTGYLTARRMMPPVEVRGLRGVTGEFDRNTFFGSDLPKTGVVRVSPSAGPSTLVHELTHAADQQMAVQYSELRRKKNERGGLTTPEQQFMTAYEKLVHAPGELLGRKPQATRGLVAQNIAPEWAKDNADYRASSAELPAWGMGSTVGLNATGAAPAHIDPTYATEFSILLDLATRLQQQTPSKGR